jgi:hypothetical protein
MADDRHYIGGDNYLLDDLSGFKIRASKARIIPGGQTGNLAVSPSRWEPQQPQDFVRGVFDDITVALSRPRQPNQFTITGTNVAAFAARGSNVIQVQGIAGFTVFDTLQIMLDNGENATTILVGISGLSFTITPVIPWSVGGTEGDPPENLIIDLGPSGRSLADAMTDSFGNVMTDSFGNWMWAGF